ncbi:MAG: uncharacterized lipoprotein YddW (UPF0748 family) [Kiritimatiellia bacterium]|jgi:uncharacterized lipoprotein YddW (UPF0748 family)
MIRPLRHISDPLLLTAMHLLGVVASTCWFLGLLGSTPTRAPVAELGPRESDIIDADMQYVDRSLEVDVHHDRQVRAVWVASVDNIDVPSRPGLSAPALRAELLAVVELAHEAHLNTLYFQVRPEGDSLYRSDLEPWSRYLSGEQGRDPGLDPLQVLLDAAHARGMRVAVWVNPFRAGLRASDRSVAPHIVVQRPDLVYTYGGHLWMDPGHDEVQRRTLAVVSDLLDRYDVDGLHIDDYFYPYPNGDRFPDQRTFADSGASDLTTWRAQRVDRLVASMHRLASQAGVPFGVSPFGLYRPGQPAGTRGFDQVASLHADPVRWARAGHVDELVPQLYWARDHRSLPFDDLARWWCTTVPDRVVLGHALYKVDRGWGLQELSEQVRVGREAGCLGDAWFSWKYLRDDRVRAHFRDRLYPRQALAPAQPGQAPVAPGVRMLGSRATVLAQEGVRAVVVYEWVDEALRVREILGPPPVELATQGSLVVSVVDAGGRESRGVVLPPAGL